MSTTGPSLVDLSPAVQVALVGALVAMLPLAWSAWRLWREGGTAAWRDRSAWQRTLTVVTLFLTIDLVVFGAFTRLTDSGLGCPDWPGCYGSASPLGAHGEISEAQAQAPTGPVTHGKAWIEMIHRYLAAGVGALITLLMALAWQRTDPHGPSPGLSRWWPTWTFVWVCVQGAFGALTVTLKLYPLVVTGHLLGGLIGVGLLSAQVRAAGASSSWTPEPLGHGARVAAVGVLGVWTLQALLGAWVSTNHAVLACAEFPTCQGRWWPDMDWSQGFTMLRALGADGQGGYIALPALTAIHMAHRLGAVLAVLALAWHCHRIGAGRAARGLLALIGLQVITGLSNVVLGWPLVAALGHTLGAALMVGWLTTLAVVSVTRSRVVQGAPGFISRWATSHG